MAWAIVLVLVAVAVPTAYALDGWWQRRHQRRLHRARARANRRLAALARRRP